MGDSSSFPCKGSNNNREVDTNQKKPKIIPTSNRSFLQPQHTRSSNKSLWHMQCEEFFVKEAQRFLVLNGHTTLAARIISCSDLNNLPVYLLQEFQNKNWYYNLDLYGSYLEYQHLCIGKKSCRNYVGYQRLAQGLGKDLTHYSFYNCVNQIEWTCRDKEDMARQAWILQKTFDNIDHSYITKYINKCRDYQISLKFHEEKVALLLELWSKVALKGKDFYQVVSPIYKYNTTKTSTSISGSLLELDRDKNQHSFLTRAFKHLCCHVKSQTGAISKGEESERILSEYFEMLKPKRNCDHLKYIKAKIHMAMDLGILSKIDLHRFSEGIQFLTESGTRKEGDTDVHCSCLGCI